MKVRDVDEEDDEDPKHLDLCLVNPEALIILISIINSVSGVILPSAFLATVTYMHTGIRHHSCQDHILGLERSSMGSVMSSL